MASGGANLDQGTTKAERARTAPREILMAVDGSVSQMTAGRDGDPAAPANVAPLRRAA